MHLLPLHKLVFPCQTENPHSLSFSPSPRFSALGGTIITVYGLWLAFTSPTAYCHFGEGIVPAMVYNATTLTCVAPAILDKNDGAFPLSDKSSMMGTSGGMVQTTVVGFGVSLNGHIIASTTNNNTTTTTTFTYFPPGVVTSVGPLQGSTLGTDTDILIHPLSSFHHFPSPFYLPPSPPIPT